MTKLRVLVLCFPYLMENFNYFENFLQNWKKVWKNIYHDIQFFIYIEHVHLNIHTINKLLFFWNPIYFIEAKFKNLMFWLHSSLFIIVFEHDLVYDNKKLFPLNFVIWKFWIF
jgi:hypothetical protein